MSNNDRGSTPGTLVTPICCASASTERSDTEHLSGAHGAIAPRRTRRVWERSRSLVRSRGRSASVKSLDQALEEPALLLKRAPAGLVIRIHVRGRLPSYAFSTVA